MGLSFAGEIKENDRMTSVEFLTLETSNNFSEGLTSAGGVETQCFEKRSIKNGISYQKQVVLILMVKC